MEEKFSLIGSVGAKQIRSQSLMDRVLPLFYKFGVRLNLSLTFSAAKEEKKYYYLVPGIFLIYQEKIIC